MSVGKYHWPAPRGDVSYPDAPIRVIVDFRPLPCLPAATMWGWEQARAVDAVLGEIALVLLESGSVDPRPVWVRADQVRRAGAG